MEFNFRAAVAAHIHDMLHSAYTRLHALCLLCIILTGFCWLYFKQATLSQYYHSQHSLPW
jgi:hypothetical protein